MSEPRSDLADEQAVVDTLYARLDELRTATRVRLTEVRRSGPSGSPQNRSERDAFATLYEDRISHLESVEDRLCFGRLDMDDESTRYVGRLGLADSHHEPLLTDWRAPAAEPFYRATAAHRGGVWRRRHLVTQGREVTHLDDDVLDIVRLSAGEEVSGDGALLAALARGRTAKMGDIVATIQAEQDAIIRSELAGALVVQGGPGTGKTAVALHRTAYLLYAHRKRLENAGVLLVGPSSAFLRYIDQVLPSLGETGVVTATIGTLLPGITASETDSPKATEIKGRAVWAHIIARAVRARERVPARPVTINADGHDLTVHPRDVADCIARARRTHKPHNEARATFVRDMLRRLADQYVAALGHSVEADERAEILGELRSIPQVRRELNIAWFPISAEHLVADLLAKPHRLAEAAPELSVADRQALTRPQGGAWTEADIPLIDEAAELLGTIDHGIDEATRAEAQRRAEALTYARTVLESTGAAGGIVDAETLAGRYGGGPLRATAAERAVNDRTWTYGHIVVDEAQELSAMAWRALQRRCPTRSFTIVGDVAQTSSAAGTRSWRDRLRPLFGNDLRQEHLTVNYRTPTRVADAASEIARAQGLTVSTLTSARDLPDALQVIETDDNDVVARAIAQAYAELSELDEGRVAVIATDPARVAQHLRERGPIPVATDGTERIEVLSPLASKGLEYDVVVLVEPSHVLAGPGGASDLFVSMTRPTRRLVIVYHDRLPQGAFMLRDQFGSSRQKEDHRTRA